MNTPDSYPEHIADPERIELAITILKKEFRKLLPGLDASGLRALDASIRGWSERPVDFHLESRGHQDFWNIVAAKMESIKLKPGFSGLITGENITWRLADLAINEIQMSNVFDDIRSIPGLVARDDLPFAELSAALEQNPPEVFEKQKAIVDSHSTDPDQDAYPIITLRKSGEALHMAMDGNRRTLRALLHGETTISAWVGEMDGTEPKNYWVPLNDMFVLLTRFQAGDDESKHAAAIVLKDHFKSEVGKIAYRHRVYQHNDAAKKLYDAAIALA